MDHVPPELPEALGPSGRSLWDDVTSRFGLDQHELRLLVQAARLADMLDTLQLVVEREGPMISSGDRSRVHPAQVEIRQLSLTFARCLAALRLPADEGDLRTSLRPPRGVYQRAVGTGPLRQAS